MCILVSDNGNSAKAILLLLFGVARSTFLSCCMKADMVFQVLVAQRVFTRSLFAGWPDSALYTASMESSSPKAEAPVYAKLYACPVAYQHPG